MKKTKHWVVATSLLAIPVPLHAAESDAEVDSATRPTQRGAGDVSGRWMLGLDTRILHTSFEKGDAEPRRLALGLTMGQRPPWLSFGYGVTSNWLLSGSLLVEHTDISDDDFLNTTTNVSVALAVSRLLGSGTVRPYVGVQAQMTRSTGNFDYAGIGGGAHGGFRIEVSDHFSIEPRTSAGYLWSRTRLELTTPLGKRTARRRPRRPPARRRLVLGIRTRPGAPLRRTQPMRIDAFRCHC